MIESGLHMESNGLIAQDVLDALSYRSTLAQSLKQISLRRTPLEIILQDIAQYRESYQYTHHGESHRVPFQK